jgi:hypothetical protein
MDGAKGEKLKMRCRRKAEKKERRARRDKC